jgi:hypothetical protein
MSSLIIPPTVTIRRRSLMLPGRGTASSHAAAVSRRLSGSLMAKKADSSAASAASAPSGGAGRFYALAKKSLILQMVHKASQQKGGTDS